MDIYGQLKLLVLAPFSTFTNVNKKAKGIYMINGTGSDGTIDIKLYSPAPNGGTPITVTIPLQNGASILLPMRVHSIGPGFYFAYEIY